MLHFWNVSRGHWNRDVLTVSMFIAGINCIRQQDTEACVGLSRQVSCSSWHQCCCTAALDHYWHTSYCASNLNTVQFRVIHQNARGHRWEKKNPVVLIKMPLCRCKASHCNTVKQRPQSDKKNLVSSKTRMHLRQWGLIILHSVVTSFENYLEITSDTVSFLF